MQPTVVRIHNRESTPTGRPVTPASMPLRNVPVHQLAQGDRTSSGTSFASGSMTYIRRRPNPAGSISSRGFERGSTPCSMSSEMPSGRGSNRGATATAKGPEAVPNSAGRTTLTDPTQNIDLLLGQRLKLGHEASSTVPKRSLRKLKTRRHPEHLVARPSEPGFDIHGSPRDPPPDIPLSPITKPLTEEGVS
jgi:hypothetical protein